MKPTPEQIDQRATRLYAQLHEHGIPLDLAALRQLRSVHTAALAQEMQTLEQLAGFWPNPNSAAHYDRIAWSHGCDLPRTPTGRPRTDEQVIDHLGQLVPALVKMANARRLRRKISILTNLERRARDGRIHPTYYLDPELGRTHAGDDANPMNWEPDIQRLVREPGRQIVVADYERMELKVLATLSGDSQLQEDLRQDPYRQAARSIFATSNPSAEQRAQAKVATLATIYGQSDRGLAAQLRIAVSQAREIQAAWAKCYPTATAFLRQLVERGRAEGCAVSYHGRAKTIPASKPLDYRDRLAINSPIQNTAGDLARVGFCNLFEDPRRAELGLELLTTVHDSVVMSVSQDLDLGTVKALLVECLVQQNDSAFHLGIQIKVGKNWADACEELVESNRVTEATDSTVMFRQSP